MSFISRIIDAVYGITNGTATIFAKGRDVVKIFSSDSSIIVNVEDTGTQRKINLRAATSGPTLFGFGQVKGDDALGVAQADQAQDQLLIKSTSNTITAVASDVDDSVDLNVVNDSNTQRIEIAGNGILKGTRKRLDFVNGFTITDNAGSNKIDLNFNVFTFGTITDGTNSAVADTIADTLLIKSTDGSIGTVVSGVDNSVDLQVNVFSFGKVTDGTNTATADTLEDTLLIKSTDNSINITASNVDDSVNLVVNQGNLNLNNINGILNVNKGGTGATSFILNALLIGNGTNPVSSLALGTANQILGMNTGATANEYKTLTSSDSTLAFTFAPGNIDARARLATALLFGVSRLSVAPVLTTDPIAVGDNDSRLVVPSGIIIKRKTANESVTNSTVLQNDDHLFFSVGINETYQVEGYMDIYTADKDPGIKIAWSVPAGATFKIAYHVNNGISTSSIIVDTMTVSGAPSSIPLKENVRHVLFFKGVIINGATAGTLRLQWAQNIADTVPTTIYANSFLKATRIL